MMNARERWIAAAYFYAGVFAMHWFRPLVDWMFAAIGNPPMQDPYADAIITWTPGALFIFCLVYISMKDAAARELQAKAAKEPTP